jgi:hypothetical protein
MHTHTFLEVERMVKAAMLLSNSRHEYDMVCLVSLGPR